MADDELLERFITKAHVSNGQLKWQALKLRATDKGGMSVARWAIGLAACCAADVNNNGAFGFAETVAGVMRVNGHEVVVTPGGFEGHAEIMLAGWNPDWPIGGPFEPAIASPEKLAEVRYYEALVKLFRYRPPEVVAEPAAITV